MRVQVFNATGLGGKAAELIRFATKNNTDIMATLETMLTPTASIPIRPAIHNFTVDKKENRRGRPEGGVLVNALSAEYQAGARFVQSALDGNTTVIEIAQTIIIFSYMTPALPHTQIQELIQLAEQLSQEGARRCVIAGDLNAHSRLLTEDHDTNTRGFLLEEALADSEFQVQRPIKGKWTSFANAGHSIPDMVIANFPIEDLVVHENESLGGSDHRPLTFTVPTEDPMEKLVDRWNIRRLAKPSIRKKYVEALHADERLPEFAPECKELQEEAPDQVIVDLIWRRIGECLSDAAGQAIGRLRFHTHASTGFWTEELQEDREEANALQEAAQEDILALHPQARVAYQRAAAHMKLYRAKLKQRATVIYRDHMDELGRPKNTAAFQKTVKGARKRLTKSANGLDPTNMGPYNDHFLTTFGGDPRGQRYRGELGIRVAAEDPSAAQLMSKEIVKETIGKLPRGKAWGADDIPAELIIEGTDDLVEPLTAYMQLLHIWKLTPTIWHKALVVPVWKKKGNKADIANYRPISLTCTGRRLYERLLLKDIQRFIPYLSDAQGGFRANRGCPHQALILHEALAHNTRLKVAFLDLRAAYDLVNRERLWTLCLLKYGMSEETVQRLAELFDHNESVLLVAGKQGEPIANKRGLLQGSSISPILFNFYINDLAEELDGTPMGIRVHGKMVNALFFADDTTLLAATPYQLAALLAKCEQWSYRAGMEFSPAKCVCFAEEVSTRYTPLRLYGTDLPAVQQATYLGYPFRHRGIDFAALCRDRTTKAKAVAAALRPLGMNMSGWAPAASALVYKTFVRPVMEYGVELKIPDRKQMELYQKAQNLALRYILQAPSHTSANAMHRILGIQPFLARAQDLNFKFANRLHNHDDASVKALHIWRRALQPVYKAQTRTSLPLLAMANPLVQEYKKYFPTVSHRQLHNEEPSREPFPIKDAAWKWHRMETIRDAHRQTDVAAAIHVRADGRAHEYLFARPRSKKLTAAQKAKPKLVARAAVQDQLIARISRADRTTISRWQLGLVAHHQPCKGCGLELSRRHALECSGAIFELEMLASEIAEAGRYGPTAMDILINAGAGKGFTAERIKVLVRNIGFIETRLKGSTRTLNGFWVRPAGDGT